MENNDLKTKISILEERIAKLEVKERKRTAFKYAKMLFTIAIIFSLAFGIWKGYEYVTEYLPDYLNSKVKEILPFNND